MLDFIFNKQAPKPLSEAEQALKSWGIKYEKKPDGSLLVPGNLDITYRGLTQLPDLTSVSVGGDFSCDGNLLTSLEGAPQTVGGNFSCSYNRLTSLEHAPHTVGGSFSCDGNRLTSLEGAPHSVGRDFSCDNNPLTSLEHAPQNFVFLKSHLGAFSSWDKVPEQLRISPEIKSRLEQARQAAKETAIQAATVLQAPLVVFSPLRFRKPTLAG